MLSWIRKKFHPLWRLRRNRVYRWFQRHCDIIVSHRVGRIEEHLYLLRDFSMLLPQQCMHENMGSTFNLILARFRPQLFLDIGANLGGYSWTVFNEVNNCEIWLFEPDQKNAELLKRSLRSSGLGKICLYECALSNRSGVAQFIVDDASGSAGSLIDQRGTFHNLQDSYSLKTTTTVETKTLDSLLDSASNRRVFIKIDVEGAETMVLEGAFATLKRHQPVIVLEAFHDAALRLLENFDYTVFDFDEDGNYLAVPPEYMGLLTPITAGLKKWQAAMVPTERSEVTVAYQRASKATEKM